MDIVRQLSQISTMARYRRGPKTHAKTDPSSEEGNGGETTDAEKYCALDEMISKLRIEWYRLLNRDGVILIHDNARPQISRITAQKLN